MNSSTSKLLLVNETFKPSSRPEASNREQWLMRATYRLDTLLFTPQGQPLPAVRVSVGFPGGGSARKRIGECWAKEAASDQIAQIFINPKLETPFQYLEVLVHELCHAVLGKDVGHRAPFKKLAVAIGLTGKMTATVAGEELTRCLNTLTEELGLFPHAALSLADRKKQTTRMMKITCPCGFIARASRQALAEYGMPSCGCGETLLETQTEEKEG